MATSPMPTEAMPDTCKKLRELGIDPGVVPMGGLYDDHYAVLVPGNPPQVYQSVSLTPEQRNGWRGVMNTYRRERGFFVDDPDADMPLSQRQPSADPSIFVTALTHGDRSWMVASRFDRNNQALDMTGCELRERITRIEAERKRLSELDKLLGDAKRDLTGTVHP